MKSGSIRFRLWLAAAISIFIALGIAGVGLRYLFERHVERRLVDDLAVDLEQLVGATDFAEGVLKVAPVLMDARFEVPLSGYYWQVSHVPTGALARSRSLPVAIRVTPTSANDDGAIHIQKIPGPDGSLLLAVDRSVVGPSGAAFRMMVAVDHQGVDQSINEYLAELAPALALLGGVLIAAFFVQITVGLAPLLALRIAVRELVAGRTARLEVAAPREVQPLAREINRLLDAQAKALTLARTRATDLAHGLKTPLQVLFADIRGLRVRGDIALADEIEKSATAIKRHVERELARARLAPGLFKKGECRPSTVIADIIGVIRRTPRGERLTFKLNAAPDLTVPIDENDFSEIIGNLAENAARFATSAIQVDVESNDQETTISVADDGPGLAEAEQRSVLLRGVTTTNDGSGLGLAIVSDIVDAYNGSLTMSDAKPGLRVTISLPRDS
jgi:signal transduction histidine kinase